MCPGSHAAPVAVLEEEPRNNSSGGSAVGTRAPAASARRFTPPLSIGTRRAMAGGGRSALPARRGFCSERAVTVLIPQEQVRLP